MGTHTTTTTMSKTNVNFGDLHTLHDIPENQAVAGPTLQLPAVGTFAQYRKRKAEKMESRKLLKKLREEEKHEEEWGEIEVEVGEEFEGVMSWGDSDSDEED